MSTLSPIRSTGAGAVWGWVGLATGEALSRIAEEMPILMTPPWASSVEYGPMKPGELTITAYPLMIRVDGSMYVADFDGKPNGITGVLGRTAGLPMGSWSSAWSSAREMYLGQEPWLRSCRS